MKYDEFKKRVYDATLNLYRAGLIRLSAGNVSLRINAELVAITPRRRSYDILKPEDICIISLDGELVEGEFKPSSETPLHTAILREMPEVGGVVHSHSIYSMTFAASELRMPILSVEALAARSNGPLPVSKYVSPGSSQAGEVAMEVFRANPGLQALLLRNHGLLAIGPDVETAWQTAYKIETAAQVAYQALQLGRVVEFSAEQVKEIFEIYMAKK